MNPQEHFSSNIKIFPWFRALFVSRFYYPVYTIMFLQFGITIEEFALLNTLWALVIVFAEVPSGALADTLGRKKLLVFASVMMISELLALLLCPIVVTETASRSAWLIPLLVINRLCSALAEAAASGADEALVYDSLVERNEENQWGALLAKSGQITSALMVVCMILGALSFDPEIVRKIPGFIDFPTTWITKAPVALNLVTATVCLFLALRFFECKRALKEGCGSELVQALNQTFDTGKWILKTPIIVITIMFGLCFDHVTRMLATISTEYYRIIHIPIAYLGVVGASTALVGLFTPKLGVYLTGRFSLFQNMGILFAVTVPTFVAVSHAWHYWGLIPAMILNGSMFLLGYMMSFYLNKFATSERRATILSFKGLLFNLAYGGVGVIYAAYLDFLRHNPQGMPSEDEVFISGLRGFAPYLTGVFIVTLCINWFVRIKFSQKCTALQT